MSEAAEQSQVRPEPRPEAPPAAPVPEVMSPERLANRAKLYGKIAAVMAEVGGVPESGRNTHFNYSYRTASDVSNAVRPVMARHGLVIIPHVASLRPTGSKGDVAVWMEYRICCAETGEQEVVRFFGWAQDNQDKAPFKAYTGIGKYFLVQLLKIGDDTDDPDAGVAGDAARDFDSREPTPIPSQAPNRSGGSKPGGSPARKADPAGGTPTPTQQDNRDAARAKQDAARRAAEARKREEEAEADRMEELVDVAEAEGVEPVEREAEAEATARPQGKAGRVPQMKAPPPAPKPEEKPDTKPEVSEPPAERGQGNPAAPHDKAIKAEIITRITRLTDKTVKLSPEQSQNVAAAGRLAEANSSPLDRLSKARDYLRKLFEEKWLKLDLQPAMELDDARARKGPPPPMSD